MKKFLALSLIGSSLLIGSNPAGADDYDTFGYQYSGDATIGNYIYGIDNATGSRTRLTTRLFEGNSISGAHISANTGELIFKTGSAKTYEAYNWETNTWRTFEIDDPTETVSGGLTLVERPSTAGGPIDSSLVLSNDGDGELIRVKTNEITAGGDSDSTLIKKNADGTIQLGTDANDIDITSEGLAIDGDPLITKKANGELHIGKNSWITKEENGKQNVYAKDADGNAIPINYTNGTDLQINGKSVQGQINTNASNIKNLGEGVVSSTALTAALTALPQTSKESKISCGVGTGAYSSKYALGFGCASKLNERVDINAGGSYVFGSSKSYGEGTLDSGIVKAGFVFKLGEINKNTQISMKEKENFETKIKTLEEKNNELLARLKRLEKVALGDLKSKDLAVYPLE